MLKLVERSGISSIREVVTEIVRILNDPLSTAKDLKDIIKKDPPLAVKVLNSASAAYYHAPQRFDDIEEAIIWIGLDTAAELALHQKVCEIFKSTRSHGRYTRQGLWKHSLAVAHGAKLLYRREFEEKGEDAYTAGLLIHLGIIMEDQFLHEEFRKILELSQKTQVNIYRVEQQMLGYDHSQLGAALLQHWALPQTLSQSIGAHHQPAHAASEFSRLASALYAIDQSCQERGLGFQDAPFRETGSLDTACKHLSIKRKALHYIVDEVEMELKRLESSGGLYGIG